MRLGILLIILLMSVCVASYAQSVTIPPGDVQDGALSVEQLQQAAAAGDPDAQYTLGYMYYYGKNVPQNTATALDWMKRASVQGQEQAVAAMHMLAPANNVADVTENDDQPAANAIKNAHQSEAAVAAVPAPIIAKTPSNYYTIQLLVTSSKTELEHYIQTHALGNKATYYATKNKGRQNYILVYGLYPTRSAAQASLAKLPAAIKAQKPWIKQISQIKGDHK